MKFLEIVGGASTTATIDGRMLGHYVNAAAYEHNGDIVVRLESNCSWIRYLGKVTMTLDEYEDFTKKQDRALFVRAIEIFGAEACL